MIKRIIITLALIIGAAGFVAPVSYATTQAPITIVGANCGNGVAAFMGFKSWDACLPHDGKGVPQLKSLSDIFLIILPLLEDALKAAGYTAAGFVLWGGIKYLKSQGDPSQLTEARLVIYNALFGLVLAMISVAIVNFIAGAIH